MSRIGKLPINIPAGVTVTLKDNVVSVKGPKGELSQAVDPSIIVTIEDNVITFTIDEANDTVEQKQKQAFHGLYRSLVNNMVVGVSEGYKKEMELVGVGYRVSNQGNIVEFSLGYTHSIFLQLPAEIKVETKSERNKTRISVSNLLTSSFWVLYAQKFVLSASLNLTRVRVFSTWANRFVVSLVSPLVLSNLNL